MKKNNRIFILLLLVGFLIFPSSLGICASILQEEPQPEFMPEKPLYKVYVKFGDLVGESMEANHKGWCEVDAFQHEVKLSEKSKQSERMISFQMEPFEIIKIMDKVTPKLNEAVTQGKVFPMIIIELEHWEGNQSVFLRYTFKNAFIISVYAFGDPKNGDALPKETVRFLCDEMTWEYKPISAQGKPEETIRTNVIFN